jgi:hypothetical protein
MPEQLRAGDVNHMALATAFRNQRMRQDQKTTPYSILLSRALRWQFRRGLRFPGVFSHREPDASYLEHKETHLR